MEQGYKCRIGGLKVKLCFEGEKQSLTDILRARDSRVQYQKYLKYKYGSTIVSYKLNIPGPVKYNPLIKEIFDEGLKAFKDNLKDVSKKLKNEHISYRNSGPEYFAVFDVEADTIKRLTTNIEENHPLGRLYDFDVLDAEGSHISRKELGMSPRKCLLCEKDAFECGRSRRHDVSQLVAKIQEMADEYFKERFKE